MNGIRASAKLVQEPGFCNQWGLDLTVGCEHACAYCHFQKYQVLTLRHSHAEAQLATSLSLHEFLELPEYPPQLYLSPFTDPLAPAARENLEHVLQRVLPRSVMVGISTKGVVSRRVFRLLATHAEQVRLIVGVTSLDEDRNSLVEPGCSPAPSRLANLRLAREHGLRKVTVRLDPILPGIDDDAGKLAALLDQIAESGAQSVTASYLFLTPFGSKRRLREVPYLGQAVEHCTDLCPIEGGIVLSVPLERKRHLYEWFAQECAARGLMFGTCGCKDLRLAQSPCTFATACSYPYLSTCTPPSLLDGEQLVEVSMLSREGLSRDSERAT